MIDYLLRSKFPYSVVSLPSNDSNAWYYPSHGGDSDNQENDNIYGTVTGNWGKKTTQHARWIRKGKMIAWGPGIEDWEVSCIPSMIFPSCMTSYTG